MTYCIPASMPRVYIRHVGQLAQQPNEAGTITTPSLHVGTLQHGGRVTWLGLTY